MGLVVIVLFHLIYVSTAVAPLSDADLVHLLRDSRARNDAARVTGMLLYKDGHFMQVLEGNEKDVMDTFSRIELDHRHKSIDVLRKEYIQYRNFPDWTMGFANVDNLATSTVPGFSRFLERGFRSTYFAEDSIEAHAMLMAFKGIKTMCETEH